MDSEELKEFERAVIAGEINDYKFYFEQAEDEDDIRAMRKLTIASLHRVHSRISLKSLKVTSESCAQIRISQTGTNKVSSY